MASPEAEARARAKYDREKYGLLPGEREALEVAQGNRCAICGRPPAKIRLHVDHCHLCGRYPKWLRSSIRGLLCHGCNRGIFREDPVVLRKAAAYFAAHRLRCPRRLQLAERTAA